MTKKLSLRLPLFAAVFALVSLTTACSDATGPTAAKRSGYITSSSAVGTVAPDTTKVTAPTSGTKKGGIEPQNSGYNVTAF